MYVTYSTFIRCFLKLSLARTLLASGKRLEEGRRDLRDGGVGTTPLGPSPGDEGAGSPLPLGGAQPSGERRGTQDGFIPREGGMGLEGLSLASPGGVP